MCNRQEVKRSFSDKVIANTARASKKVKILSPLFLVIAGALILADKFVLHFFHNGKRYITMVLCLIFFFMSSSFAFPKDMSEDEIILSQSSVENVYDDNAQVPLADDINANSAEEVEWIEDSDISDNSIIASLSNTDDTETFTLDDFLKEDIIASDYNNDESMFDKDAWNLLLVNKTHPIPENYEVKLATISGSMKCDERVQPVLLEMLKDARKDGVDLMVCSPYRDYKLQSTLFERKINAYMALGYSYVESYKRTSQKVTVPGASEHQLGLAFDIVTPGHSTLDYEFGDTNAGKWLKDNCKNYGFILRYPRGKEYITSIEYEPWHFRYVGKEAATYIMENEITLEEFIEELE